VKSFFDAIFFDMDGLMVDSEPQWLLSETELTAEYGYAWTSADQVACLGGPLTRVGAYMFEKCKRVESPEFFTQELIKIQAGKMRRVTPLMPGAIELVSELQSLGVKTGLVSASPRIIVDAVLDNIGINLFPFTISSDDVERTKPWPDGYLKAAKFTSSDISDCLIFEDSLTGVQAAQSSGAWLIAVPHLVQVKESERVRVIRSLEKIDYQKLVELWGSFSSPI
jgi:HAD superfamily hydrolase (TIGR01509 family)